MRCVTVLTFCCLVCLPAVAETCPTQSKTTDSLLAMEHAWAQALEHQDANAVGCILAPEFEDADVYGNLHDRADALERVAHRKPGSNDLADLTPHLFSDFGYVRGLNRILNPEGDVVAKVRFTDIFVYREGRWMAVAGQETLLTESPE
jgi:hypothetical protein